jgi:lipopolysaccharide/colanic/teichoic acid biosynthesis glycosyltransferase
VTTKYHRPKLQLPISPQELIGRFGLAKNPKFYALKRCFDIIFSSVMLVLLTPLFLVVSICIWLEDGWPIFYIQDRVGKNGEIFRFIKFRSMYNDADARRAALFDQYSDSVRFKMAKDPRITKVGRWIRRGSIDELPQFWNVLKGDMSVVGPRPALPEEVSYYTPHQLQRLRVLQGLTCIWQVRGRSLIPFEEQVELDLEYIQTQSFWLDLKLVALTIPAVLSRRGAY